MVDGNQKNRNGFIYKERMFYMEKRFKKEELIRIIEDLKISKSEFWILSSGA